MRKIRVAGLVQLLGLALVFTTFACGGGSSGGGGDDDPLPPELDAVNPTMGSSAGGTTITLTGENFSGNPAVTVGGMPCTNVIFLSDKSVSCTTPPGTSGATVDVSITTSAGSDTLPGSFSYVDPFNGTYFLSSLALSVSGPSGIGSWGTTSSAGTGMTAGGTATSNTQGVIGTPTALPPSSYTVDGMGSIVTSTTPGGNLLQGGITSDGRVANFISIRDTTPSSLEIITRRQGTFDASSLTDVYHAVLLEHRTLMMGTAPISWWGQVQFDGLSMAPAATPYTLNVDGAVGSPVGPFNDTYTVQGDGTVNYVLAPRAAGGFVGATLQGGVLLGGDLVVVAGATMGTESPMIGILIKASTSASAATLSGNYIYVHLRALTNSTFQATVGTAVSDGVNTITLSEGMINADGTISTGSNVIDIMYTVDGSGQVNITTGIPAQVGGVSSDGNFACWAGGTSGGDRPELYFLLRY